MIRRRGGLFLICLCTAFLFGTGFAQECNDDMMRRCRRDGLDVIEATSRQTSRNDINDQCRTLRENFDCILFQTSTCLDKEGQDDNRDSIVRIWRYLQSFCESQGNWYTRTCFQRDDVRRCESLLPSRGHSTDVSSCRSFDSFRNCVTAIVEIDCSTSDKKLLGSYLMEKGQQKAWNCPRSQYPASAPLAADMEGFTSPVENSYGYCANQARYELRECETQFDSARNEAKNYNDDDMRHHRTCCAMVHYEECVKQKLEDRCGSDRSKSEARDIIDVMKKLYPYQSCGDHTMTECSGTAMATASFILCILFAMISKFASHKL